MRITRHSRILTATAAMFLSWEIAAAQVNELPVGELVERLGGDQVSTVTAAMDDLTALGADAKEAVPALVGLLRSSNLELVWRAERTLGAIGEEAGDATQPLIELLAHEDARVRAYAAFALGRIGAAAAIDRLVECAFDGYATVRRSAIRALQRMNPPIDKTLPLVMKVLEQGDLSIIMPALASLAEEGERAVPRLREALKHEKARYWACLALAEMGPAAAAAVPELSAVLDTAAEPDTRLQSLVALGEIGAPARSALPSILRLLESEEFPNVRYAAVFAIGKIGGSDEARDILTKSLESDDEFLRTISAWALARNGAEDSELVQRAVRMIVDAFKSDDVNVRRAAARAAVEFDVDPKLVAPALVEALRDKDDTVVANAIDALASLGPKALAHVDQALRNVELRHYAVRLIGRLGPEANLAVPALIDTIGEATNSEDDQEFVREAQIALSMIGPAAKDAIPTLMKSLKSENDEVVASAAFALGKMGPAARGAVVELRGSLSNESTLVRLASLRALLELQPGQPQLAAIAAPMLIQALHNDSALVRAEAASALGELGALGRRAIPTLRSLLSDEHEAVREAAGEALRKLES